IQQYFEMSRFATVPLSEKRGPLLAAFSSPNDFIGQEAVYQLVDEPIGVSKPFYDAAFKSDNIFIRQAIALSLEEIPTELQSAFETLLNDVSYVTKEAALYGLWRNFPEKRAKYLDAMEDVVGFQDKNVRQLWLALAIVSPNYKLTQKEAFRNELRGYTSPAYSFEVRQKAFEYINEIQLYNEDVLHNLVNASVHHNWRFREFARTLLSELFQNPGVKEGVFQNINSFSEEEKNYLLRIK
ncbi:MAG: M1 family peptidase, partial [Marinirhabdus sp.]|nr:M1 family peptidase [Marinirhabdus sp.]